MLWRWYFTNLSAPTRAKSDDLVKSHQDGKQKKAPDAAQSREARDRWTFYEATKSDPSYMLVESELNAQEGFFDLFIFEELLTCPFEDDAAVFQDVGPVTHR